MKNRTWFSALLITLAFSLLGCESESPVKGQVPITQTPTRPINEALLGNWQSTDRGTAVFDNRSPLFVKIRAYDEYNYIITINDSEFHAYHSDVDQIPFLSFHDINTEERYYIYMTWRLEEAENGGKRIYLELVERVKSRGSLIDSTRLYNELKEFETRSSLRGEMTQLVKISHIEKTRKFGKW